ncbi:MAG: tRNA (N6-isopentenyl adenosine(37)-C2)-methylthiotransferase MiaB [Campylobacterales bacterium]
MKYLFLETLGCAMNERDSEHIVAELNEIEPYSLCQSVEEADLIIINTCSVREKPVQKLFSELGVFNKKKKQDAKIGVCGCTASHLGEEIFKRAPYVSFVLGARQVSKIKDVVHKERSIEVGIDYDDTLYTFAKGKNEGIRSLINISIGCDKSCSYCIVPQTRGAEISIPSDLILDEVKRSVDSGISEIFLLGQNVNSYGVRFSKESPCKSFVELLREVSKVSGVKRIRFTSPHPLHMDDEFIEEFAYNPKICKSIHMPLQSGSTKVLRDMRRGYTKEWFLAKAMKIREMVPEVTIGTDVIVAYPSESYDDFLESIDVVEQVGFEHMYSFVFSPRPLTPAQNLKSDIPIDEAKKRLEILQTKQKELAIKKAKSRVGSIYEVLIEARNQNGFLEGRSDNYHLVKTQGDDSLIGRPMDVKITKAEGASLYGEVLSRNS